MRHPFVAAFVVVSAIFVTILGVASYAQSERDSTATLIESVLLFVPIAVSLLLASYSLAPAVVLCIIGVLFYGGAYIMYGRPLDLGVIMVLWPIATLVSAYAIGSDSGYRGGGYSGGSGSRSGGSDYLKDSLGPMTYEEQRIWDEATGYSDDPDLSGFGYNAVNKHRRERYRRTTTLQESNHGRPQRPIAKDGVEKLTLSVISTAFAPILSLMPYES